METSLKQLVRCPLSGFLPRLHAAFVSCLTTRSAHFHASAPWQNNGQGLGFVLAGSVLDKRSLKAMFLKLVAAVSTVVGYILVLADDVATDTAVGDMVCDLTTVQKSMV
eukprot:COSAG06_NODE_26069_length_622_cov_1.390057_1_plen_108_part_10